MDSNDITERLTNLSPAQRALFEQRLKQTSLKRSALLTIHRRDAREFAPLSFAQQRLWFLNQLEPHSPAYNEPQVVRLTGALDVEALEKSLNHIIARHEILRTTIASHEESLIQRIEDRRTIDLPLVDLRDRAAQDREVEARRLVNEAIRRPFDLSRDLMLRVLLLQLDDREHILVLLKHHIASDGWSSAILWQELAALYEAYTTGQSPHLRELPVQYADYAIWQQEWLQGDVLEAQLSYWRKQLDNLATLQLPADRPRPAMQSYQGARQTLTLPSALSQALKAFSRKEGVTLFMTLLAAFQTLLYRYTGQQDIAVGSPIAGRNRAEIEGLLGFFVNTLVLRTEVSQKLTFKELLGRVRGVCLEAYSHQSLPFEKLVEELQPHRNLSHNPLFQVTFQLNNTPRPSLKLNGIEVVDLEFDGGIAKFDLSLAMSDRGEHIGARLQYNTDLFDAATITWMLGHFETLLEGIVADPDRRISDLPLLTDAEKQQQLMQWNQTQRDYPRDKCLHELFEKQVKHAPKSVAVVCEGRQLTYEELNRRGNQLAHYLRKSGVGSGALVGICVERSLEMIVGLLGILKAGAAYVPLDPEYPQERLAFMIRDTRMPVLLTQERWLSRLPVEGPRVVCSDRDCPEIEKENGDNPEWKTPAQSLAYVVYTSGSSGEPKGVAVPHRAVSRLVVNTDYVQLSDRDVVAQASNISFDAATFEIWGALLNGARLAVLAKETLLAPQSLAGAIERQGITALFLTTALFNQMAEHIPNALARLDYLLFGGETADPERVRALLKQGAPKRLLHVYGPTESTTFATWHAVSAVAPGATHIPIGKPIANTRVYILDDYLNPVPLGVKGEIYIGGEALAQGYFNRAELTAERFIANPFTEAQPSRLYKTGDQGRYLPDGDIEFIGRLDNQVKIRGYRIEPGEIETALGRHPSVKDCLVVAHQGPDEGKDDRRLAVYVALSAQLTPSAQDLRAFLKHTLPDYMIPSAFYFLDEMPVTAKGKIDRQSLTALATRAPDPAPAAPRTNTEEAVARIWQKLLKLDGAGIHDNFFDLGGHSLLAIRLLNDIRQRFTVDLPVRAIFEAPTVAGLASLIDAQQGGESSGAIELRRAYSFLVELQAGVARPPLFIIPGGSGREDELLALGRLVRAVDTHRQCYGLRARSASRTERAHSEVREMAWDYLKEARAVQPNGPYLLIGECIAAVVAHEMARQLRADGQEVALLAMLDARPPHRIRYLKYRSKLPFDKYKRRIKTFWRRRLYGSHESSRAWKNQSNGIGRNAVSSQERPVTAAPGDPSRGGILSLIGLRQPSVKRSYIETLYRCRPQPYQGSVTLFFCEQANWQSALEGWKKLVLGKIDVRYVPGDHVTYIRDHVEGLARQLRICMDAAETRQNGHSIVGSNNIGLAASQLEQPHAGY